MDPNTGFILTILIIVGIPCLTMFGISWARHRPTTIITTQPLPPAFQNLPPNVDYIVRSAEQPSVTLLNWSDETRSRVFPHAEKEEN